MIQRGFPGVRPSSTDLQAVRDRRRSTPLFIEFDLSVARSRAAGTHADLNIAGNAFYCDPIIDATAQPIGGLATAFFEDSSLTPGLATPFTLAPQFIARIPFTRVILENAAQPGKRLRIIYGVDLDFQPGISAQVQITGTVATNDFGTAYGVSFQSSALLAANTPENVWAAASNVNGSRIVSAGLHSANATGLASAALLCKATAPAGIVDGHLINLNEYLNDTANKIVTFKREKAILVPSGLRGDFLVSAAETGGYRQLKYTLL